MGWREDVVAAAVRVDAALGRLFASLWPRLRCETHGNIEENVGVWYDGLVSMGCLWFEEIRCSGSIYIGLFGSCYLA